LKDEIRSIIDAQKSAHHQWMLTCLTRFITCDVIWMAVDVWNHNRFTSLNALSTHSTRDGNLFKDRSIERRQDGREQWKASMRDKCVVQAPIMTGSDHVNLTSCTYQWNCGFSSKWAYREDSVREPLVVCFRFGLCRRLSKVGKPGPQKVEANPVHGTWLDW